MSAPLADEMKRTTVLRSVVLPLPPREILALGKRYFVEQGYRALPAGTPNALMVRGGREGALPSVIGEISVQEKQSPRGRTSVVSLSAYGERLGPHMTAFYEVLRAERQRVRAGDAAPPAPTADEEQDA
jgi:hypothetical protein